MAVDRELIVRDDGIEIRSYRVVFELERRLHRIDRFRIPLPYGLPLRGLAYGAAALVAIVFVGTVPVIGSVVADVPPPARFVVVPVGIAALLTNVRIDGRPVHRVAGPFLRLHLGASRVAGFQPARLGPAHFADLTIAPDESGGRARPMRIAGPASVVLRVPATLRTRGATLIAETREAEPEAAGKRIVLRPRQQMVVTCADR